MVRLGENSGTYGKFTNFGVIDTHDLVVLG